MPGQPQNDLQYMPPGALPVVNEEERHEPYMMPTTVAMPGEPGYVYSPPETVPVAYEADGGHVSSMMPATVAMPG